MFNTISGRKIAMLGFAFKQDSETPAPKVVKRCLCMRQPLGQVCGNCPLHAAHSLPCRCTSTPWGMRRGGGPNWQTDSPASREAQSLFCKPNCVAADLAPHPSHVLLA